MKKVLIVVVAAFFAISSGTFATIEVLGGSPPGCC